MFCVYCAVSNKINIRVIQINEICKQNNVPLTVLNTEINGKFLISKAKCEILQEPKFCLASSQRMGNCCPALELTSD